MPLENKGNRWVVVATFLLPHSISTNPITPNHRYDIMDQFSLLASGKMPLTAGK